MACGLAKESIGLAAAGLGISLTTSSSSSPELLLSEIFPDVLLPVIGGFDVAETARCNGCCCCPFRAFLATDGVDVNVDWERFFLGVGVTTSAPSGDDGAGKCESSNFQTVATPGQQTNFLAPVRLIVTLRVTEL